MTIKSNLKDIKSEVEKYANDSSLTEFTQKQKTEFMKKHTPLILIIVSAILIIANFIFSEEFDRGFWLTTLSSVLIIISMVLTIRENKKQGKN
ncbi:hypothetical protein [Maribacter polysaccharolyticus]|uniref:hypothetical protein n=1 Tax=Maribacter polysaccharolyticus TaxID=3020831 RepID=UPI00237F7F1B|nr:hypothetical protein [Maribacter polysaccharolyticus]MDE3743275.1 hypothetical protein [Maribacter polysaccharolyticus]